MATSTRTRGKSNTVPTESTETVSEQVAPEETTQATEPTTRKARAPIAKGSDAVILGGFTRVQASAAPKKKHDRDNPFDEPVAESYKDNLEKTKEYLSFVTLTDKVDAQCKLIRSAASFLEIGSAIRVENFGDPGVEELEEGQSRIYFRGQDKIVRKTKNADTEVSPVEPTE